MKKLMLTLMAFMVLFTFTASDIADARRGGFSSGKRSFTNTPKKAPESSNVSRTDSGTKSGAANTTNPAQRGFFGGGSFMKGLMIGGLAGLLFGGIFGGMGFLGDLLGLIINVLAIYFLFVIIRSVVQYWMERKKLNDSRNRS